MVVIEAARGAGLAVAGEVIVVDLEAEEEVEAALGVSSKSKSVEKSHFSRSP